MRLSVQVTTADSAEADFGGQPCALPVCWPLHSTSRKLHAGTPRRAVPFPAPLPALYNGAGASILHRCASQILQIYPWLCSPDPAGDFGIIGTLRECRKEDSCRFPINGSIGSTAGRPRCKICLVAAATSNRAPSFVQTAAR